MLSVTLKPDVAEQISQIAGESKMETEAVVDTAVRAYLRKRAEEKIRAEQKEFNEQKESLLVKYKGEYVAVHNGEVIDHDPSIGELHRRVHKSLGRIPVLLKKVTDEPDRVLVFRSPKLQRIQP